MARCEEAYTKNKAKKKDTKSLTTGSDKYRARALRAEYFEKPLSVRKAITKAKATQMRLF